MTLFDTIFRSGYDERSRLRNWLETLKSEPPEMCARSLEGALERMCRSGSSRRRLRVLEALFPSLESVVALATQRLRGAPLPLSDDARQLLDSTNTLLKHAARQYTRIAEEGGSKWSGVGYAQQRMQAILRALACHASRLELGYSVRYVGATSAWRALHALHRLGTSQSVKATPELDALYLRTLAIALADPIRLDALELAIVRTCAYQATPRIRLLDVDTCPAAAELRRNCFLFHAGADARPASLLRLERYAKRSGDVVADLASARDMVAMQLEALARGIAPATLGYPANVPADRTTKVLQHVLRCWDGGFSRRFSRKVFFPRGDVVVGFSQVCAFLRDAAFRRRADDPVPASAGAEVSEWSIANESADGFALCYRRGSAITPLEGELIGLRSAEHAELFVCVIRRIESTASNGLEIGVRKIGAGARSVGVFKLDPQLGASGAAVGVLVTQAPREPGAFVMIFPSGLAEVGTQFRIPVFGAKTVMVATAVTERCRSGDVVTVRRAG